MKDNMGVPASPSGCQPSASAAPLRSASSQSGIPNAALVCSEFQGFRAACAEAAKPFLRAAGQGWPVLETYANTEFWAGWNAGIMHAARVARVRHACWQESPLGSSQPEDDISACEDIAAAIEGNVHRKPCPSRPRTASCDRSGEADEPATQIAGSAEGESAVGEAETPNV